MSGVEALLLLSSVLLLMMILAGSKALTGVPRAEIGGVILGGVKPSLRGGVKLSLFLRWSGTTLAGGFGKPVSVIEFLFSILVAERRLF